MIAICHFDYASLTNAGATLSGPMRAELDMLLEFHEHQVSQDEGRFLFLTYLATEVAQIMGSTYKQAWTLVLGTDWLKNKQIDRLKKMWKSEAAQWFVNQASGAFQSLWSIWGPVSRAIKATEMYRWAYCYCTDKVKVDEEANQQQLEEVAKFQLEKLTSNPEQALDDLPKSVTLTGHKKETTVLNLKNAAVPVLTSHLCNLLHLIGKPTEAAKQVMLRVHRVATESLKYRERPLLLQKGALQQEINDSLIVNQVTMEDVWTPEVISWMHRWQILE